MWILWTFIPYLAWIGWLTAGIRTKHKGYFLWAILYVLPFVFLLVVDTEKGTDGKYTAAYNTVQSFSIIVWIGGIIHALSVRKEVNLKIKSAKQTMTGKVKRPEELKDTSAECGVPHTKSSVALPPPIQPSVTPPSIIPRSPAPSASQMSAGESSMGNSVNINSADEQEIASLPGVGPILAMKAISFRQSEGPFQSVDHFSQVLGLKPTVLQQLRARIVVSSTQPPKTPESRGSRVIDF